MVIIKKFLYDASLPAVSKAVIFSTVIGCLPGMYMCYNADLFELVSNNFWVNKAFNLLSFGIFLAVPLSLFLIGLIPSRLLRWWLSLANTFQLKLFSFLSAINAYADVIKTTAYFEILYKYSLEEKLQALRALNIKQANSMAVPPLPEAALNQIAVECNTMGEVKAYFFKTFDSYSAAIIRKLEEQAYADASWVPLLKTCGSPLVDLAPYIIGVAIISIIGYKMTSFFNLSSEALLTSSDGIRIQQRVDCLQTQVLNLANEQARLAEIVCTTHSTLTNTVVQNTTISQSVAGLADSMLTHSQLLDGVIQVLVSNPELLATARRLQQAQNFPRLTS